MFLFYILLLLLFIDFRTFGKWHSLHATSIFLGGNQRLWRFSQPVAHMVADNLLMTSNLAAAFMITLPVPLHCSAAPRCSERGPGG